MERAHEKYERLLEFCRSLPPTPTAVAHPCDESSLRGAVEAGQLGLIAPILVGPRVRIEALAKQYGIDLANIPIVDAPYSEASAAKATAAMMARLIGVSVLDQLIRSNRSSVRNTPLGLAAPIVGSSVQ